MHCIVTAGPTYEPLDSVRRLTNFSTGRLGSELGNHLVSLGHQVTLFLGESAKFQGKIHASRVVSFGTTTDLRDQLKSLADSSVGAVFHAAAVSDFAFGKIWLRSDHGDLSEVHVGKISTRQGTLLAELVPTPKIISGLRDWFPQAILVGWKYEVDGDRDTVLRIAQRQIIDCRTDACVANGPAYGSGFGIVAADSSCIHLTGPENLYEALGKFLRK